MYYLPASNSLTVALDYLITAALVEIVTVCIYCKPNVVKSEKICFIGMCSRWKMLILFVYVNYYLRVSVSV